MSAAECARAASDLTALVARLDRARRALVSQSRLPEEQFGGLSGDAYRRHAARSAVTVAGAGSDLALLAGALAALGRELDDAEQLRWQALGARADAVERFAQERWRAAVASYEQGQPCPGQRPLCQPVVPGMVVGPSPASSPGTAAPSPVDSAPGPAPVPAAPEPGPVLDSALVISPPKLESELVIPSAQGVLDEHC